MGKVNIGIIIQVYIILAENFQETFGLALEFGRTLSDFADNLLISQLFETVMNVASLLMQTHEPLGSVEEALLNLNC